MRVRSIAVTGLATAALLVGGGTAAFAATPSAPEHGGGGGGGIVSWCEHGRLMTRTVPAAEAERLRAGEIEWAPAARAGEDWTLDSVPAQRADGQTSDRRGPIADSHVRGKHLTCARVTESVPRR